MISVVAVLFQQGYQSDVDDDAEVGYRWLQMFEMFVDVCWPGV